MKMNSTDFLNLSGHKLIENVKKSLPGNISKCLNVLTVKDNVLFTWDFESHCVLTLNIKAARENGQNEAVICQKLLPLCSTRFSPERIVVNELGTLLIVAGLNGVLVMKLPTRCPPYGSFNNNKELVYCETYSLDERLLMFGDGIDVLQVKFHPGSVKDNHILLLTSDNTLRLYQIEDRVVNLGVFQVGEKPMAKMPCSKMTFLGALGEIAVDFDFGHPEINEEKPEESSVTVGSESKSKALVKIRDPLNDSETIIAVVQPDKARKHDAKNEERDSYSKFNWPVYVVSGDFIIKVINIPLHEKTGYSVRGPLPLIPCSVLDYTKRACSIICLSSNPQIVCIGSTNGDILHGLVLPITQELLEDEDKDTSLSELKKVADREIYFFETIGIELGLETSQSFEEGGYTSPIFLHKDEARCDRYFATHSAGVHTVSIGCIENLEKFNESDNANDIFSISSTPEYLICTKTTATKTNNPVIGFSVYYNPHSIITLLANGNLVSLALMTVSLVPKMEKLTLDPIEVVSSPLKEMLKAPFEQHIQNILRKADSHPIMKLPKNDKHSLKECHELIQKTSQIFKDKFKYHNMAREEIEKRATTLLIFKEYQLKELENMNQEKRNLQEKAENLAEKYEDIRETQATLLKRCAKLLITLSMKRDVLCDAEVKYIQKLKEMRGKLDKCDSTIEKLIVKKNYQESQMRNWKNQLQKKSGAISETHRNTIKDSLMDSSTKINRMIEEVKSFKKQLHLN